MSLKIAHLASPIFAALKGHKNRCNNPKTRFLEFGWEIYLFLALNTRSLWFQQCAACKCIRRTMLLPTGITTLSSYPRAREKAERLSVLSELPFPIKHSQGEIR